MACQVRFPSQLGLLSGPITGFTPITLPIFIMSEVSSFEVFFNKSLITTLPGTLITNSLIQLNFTTLPNDIPGLITLEVEPCIGNILYNYYDESVLEVTMLSTIIGSLGGTTLSLQMDISNTFSWQLQPPLWVLNLKQIHVQLLSQVNNNKVMYTLGKNYGNSNTTHYIYSTMSTELVSSLGLNSSVNIYISYNSYQFSILPFQSVYIQQRQPIHVLFMYNSKVDDHGWTNAHNDAKLLAANHFSIALQIDFIEELKIYDGGYIESHAESRKYDIIFVCTDFHRDYFVPLTAKYPHITFVLVSNDALMTNPPITNNLIYTTVLLNEGVYLSGVVGAHMIPQGGLVCFVKGFDVSSVQQGLNAFALGI